MNLRCTECSGDALYIRNGNTLCSLCNQKAVQIDQQKAYAAEAQSQRGVERYSAGNITIDLLPGWGAGYPTKYLRRRAEE